MKRRLFNLLAGVSLVLCVATGVMWVRSYYVAETLSYHGVDWRHVSDSRYFLRANQGALRFGFNYEWWDTPQHLKASVKDASDGYEVIGFSHVEERPGQQMSMGIPMPAFEWDLQESGPGRVIVSGSTSFVATISERSGRGSVPFWFLTLVFALLPLSAVSFKALARWRRWRRMRIASALRICAVCGYDLRATPDRCPECGAAVAKEPVEAK